MTEIPTTEPGRRVKLAGAQRDRRRGRVVIRALGIDGPPPFEQLRELRAEAPGRVLSAAVSVDARRGEALDPGWRLRFRNAARQELETIADRTEALIFARLVRWIEGRLDGLSTADLRRALFLVATERPRHLELYTLPRPVADHFRWSDCASLEPLEALEATYPPTGIVLLDGRLARFITTYLGDVLDEAVFWFDLDTSGWRRMEGRAPGALTASGATHTDRFDRRVRAAEAQWVRALGPVLKNTARHGGWRRAVLVTVPGFEVAEADLTRWAGIPVVRHERRGWSGRPASAIAEAILDDLASLDEQRPETGA
jgi:hypothetical protein